MSTKRTKVKEGLGAVRALMVLSSFAPLFVLWAIRGNCSVPEPIFSVVCGLFAVIPTVVLYLRCERARMSKDERDLVVGSAEDSRDHVLVYLFAMLLPFYAANLGGWRDTLSTVTALAFIVFMFWHLNLHYMNIWFAILGFRVFTIQPPEDGNSLSGRTSLVLITRRLNVRPGQSLQAYRLSDTVYLENDE